MHIFNSSKFPTSYPDVRCINILYRKPKEIYVITSKQDS